MRPTILAVAATLLLMTPASDAASQELATLAPGTRIRVTARKNLGPIPEVGTVVTVSGDTLRFTSDQKGHQFVLLRSSINRLEVSAGPGSSMPNVLKGSAIGAAGGAGAAFVIAFIVQNITPDCIVFCTEPTTEESERRDANDARTRRQAAVAGAAIGAILGGAIGSRKPGERWTKATLVSRTQLDVSIRPRGVGGIALELSGSF
jgi:hypothetical protein